MSKTKGTGVDPLQLTQEYGTDALRYMLVSMAAPGSDIALSEDRLGGAKAFANKIWNAARFIFFNFDKMEQRGTKLEDVAAPDVREEAPYAYKGELPLADEWLFGKLAATVGAVNEALDNYRFHEAAQSVYHFFWGDFCDWYIEWIKPDLQDPNKERALVAWKNLFAAFDLALRSLHPFMPFISEELWHQLPQNPGDRSIALQEYPSARSHAVTHRVNEFANVQEVIGQIRNMRAEMKLDPKKRVAAEIYSSDPNIREQVERNRGGIVRLGLLSELQVGAQKLPETGGITRSTGQFEVRIPYAADTVDVAAELTRLKKEIEGLQKAIRSKESQLGSVTFRERAPQNVIQQMENALAEQRIELQKLLERQRRLKDAA